MTALLLDRLYDADLVEEDAFTKWNAGAPESAFKAAVQPFITWLQCARLRLSSLVCLRG